MPGIIMARFTPGFCLATAFVCGVFRISYKKLLADVTVHVLAWEAIFLALGTLGDKIANFFNPQTQPILLVVWITMPLTIGATLAYFLAFRKEEHNQ